VTPTAGYSEVKGSTPAKVGEHQMTEAISDKLVVEEFKQMHEHMRQRETAMGQLLTVTTTGAMTLLAATAAVVFHSLQSSPLVYCYILRGVTRRC
jgi:hypothetical protein